MIRMKENGYRAVLCIHFFITDIFQLFLWKVFLLFFFIFYEAILSLYTLVT